MNTLKSRMCPLLQFGSIVLFTLTFVTPHYKVLCLECPQSADAWKRASQALQCKDPNYYHCLLEDNGRLVEQCLGKLWIQPGMCPEYNSRVTRIDVTECTSPTCPESVYWSNAVYLYPVCYGSKKETTPQVPRPTPQITTESEVLVTSDYQTNNTIKEHDIDNDSTGSLRSPGGEGNTSLIVGMSIAGALVLITALVLVYFCRKGSRHNRSKQEDVAEPESGTLLQSDDIHKQQAQEEQKGKQENHQQQGNEVVQSIKVHGSGISDKVSHLNEGCQVYIPGGPGTGSEFNYSTRILVLVTSSPEIRKQMEEAARATFGRKYIYCKTLAFYLESMQEQETTYLFKDFHLKTSDVEAILRKLRDVVSVTSIPFVVTVPLDLWSSNREKCTSIIEKDVVFKSQYI